MNLSCSGSMASCMMVFSNCDAVDFLAERRTISEDLFVMVPSSIANRALYYPPIKSVQQVAAGYLQAPSSTEVWYSVALGYGAFDLGMARHPVTDGQHDCGP